MNELSDWLYARKKKTGNLKIIWVSEVGLLFWVGIHSTLSTWSELDVYESRFRKEIRRRGKGRARVRKSPLVVVWDWWFERSEISPQRSKVPTPSFTIPTESSRLSELSDMIQKAARRFRECSKRCVGALSTTTHHLRESSSSLELAWPPLKFYFWPLEAIEFRFWSSWVVLQVENSFLRSTSQLPSSCNALQAHRDLHLDFEQSSCVTSWHGILTWSNHRLEREHLPSWVYLPLSAAVLPGWRTTIYLPSLSPIYWSDLSPSFSIQLLILPCFIPHLTRSSYFSVS